MWVPSSGAADPIFPGKNWRPFLVITVHGSAVSSPPFLLTTLVSLGDRPFFHFSGIQKFAAAFLEAPDRLNMQNMPKSAADQRIILVQT